MSKMGVLNILCEGEFWDITRISYIFKYPCYFAWYVVFLKLSHLFVSSLGIYSVHSYR